MAIIFNDVHTCDLCGFNQASDRQDPFGRPELLPGWLTFRWSSAITVGDRADDVVINYIFCPPCGQTAWGIVDKYVHDERFTENGIEKTLSFENLFHKVLGLPPFGEAQTNKEDLSILVVELSAREKDIKNGN